MISFLDLEDEHTIYSASGQIEFLIFYDRIKHLVDFYNYSMKCYQDLLYQKNQERVDIENNIEEILKSDESHEIYLTRDEVYFPIEEEILGIEMNFLEYQKMTFIIILFSEIEKLIDNLYELNQQPGNVKKINIKLQNLYVNKRINEEDTNRILDIFNNLNQFHND
ncbi:hypothetical protein, partial [Paenibacillus rigui]